MKYLLSILFFIITFSLSAQEAVSVAGFIKDKNSDAIEGAAIRALTADSVFLSGTTSDAGGYFILMLPRKKCILEISYLGYQKSYRTISADTICKNLLADTIKLQEESINLAEVMVTGKAAAMQMKGDTLEYNTGIYALSDQASVRDLLKLLPNVTVTEHGQILVQGKPVSKILVDGKDFFSNNPEMASKSLPGKIVDKVQVIDQSSEVDRLTGFDNGDKETVLNLSVKEENKVGVMAQAAVGGGRDINDNKTRYEQNAYINLLKRQDMFSLMLRNDNTNSGTGSSQTGDNSVGQIGLLINKEFSNRFNVYSNVTYTSIKSVENMLTDQETILSPESSLFDSSNRLSDTKNKVLDVGIRTEWTPNGKNTLITQAYLNYSKKNRWDNELFNSYNGLRDTLYNGHSATENNGNNYSLNISIDYAHRLKKKGRVFSTSLYGIINQGDARESYSWNRRMYDNNVYQYDSLVNQRTVNENSGKQIKLGLSYVEPITEKRFIQIAYTARLSGDHVGKNTYKVGEDVSSDNLQLLPSQSPGTSQSIFNQRFTLNYKSLGEKTDYTMGMNVDIDDSENKTRFPDDSFRANVNQKVTNYSPVLNIKHRFNKSNTLTLDYMGTMTSPTGTQLQDYTDISDPTNSIKGNPDLKPQFANDVVLNLSGSNSKTQGFYDVGLFGGYTANAIQSSYNINPETGNRTTSYKNVNGNWNAQFRCIYYTPINETNFTISNGLRGGYDRKKGLVNDEVSVMGSFTIDENLVLRYYTPDFYFNIQGLFKYVILKGQGQSTDNMETRDWGTELNASYLLPYKIRLSSSFRWSLKKGYSGETGNIRENILDVAIERDCFSKKYYGTGTIQISAFDLLQSRRDLSRNVGASYIQNTRTSTMGSYFMCRFVYSFNFFP